MIEYGAFRLTAICQEEKQAKTSECRKGLVLGACCLKLEAFKVSWGEKWDCRKERNFIKENRRESGHFRNHCPVFTFKKL